jgi:hypothetical protein
MTFVLAIGDDKKWQGRAADFLPLPNVNNGSDPLWCLTYEDVKEFIRGKWQGNLLTSTGEISNNKTGSRWSKVFVYDKKGNVFVLVSKNGVNKDYELVDKYKLSEPPPDWGKIAGFQSLAWEYDRIKKEMRKKQRA